MSGRCQEELCHTRRCEEPALGISQHLARKGSVGRLPSVCYFLGLVQATDEYTDSRQEVKQMNLWRNCTIAGRAQALLSKSWHYSYPGVQGREV